MRIKREYLTPEPPPPKIAERLGQIEKMVSDILAHEMEPEEPGPTTSDIMDRLNILAQKIERIAATAPAVPAPQKQPYQFDVIRNAAGDIERIMAKPVTSNTIYGGH